MEIQRAYVQASLVDRRALDGYRRDNDALMAAATLRRVAPEVDGHHRPPAPEAFVPVDQEAGTFKMRPRPWWAARCAIQSWGRLRKRRYRHRSVWGLPRTFCLRWRPNCVRRGPTLVEP
ncbi:hypothetical protein DPM13_01130 [Paracoccus mutanolyticus]|uniref:Uncharacterized protein n=1 Tax=Paracoccus mutanolyticus TaxID=1499308 RepID=A0ABN5M3W9_9RHOB|nr:hypothetical protein DPM13_01130 [Paracoccus mutanolyticus]